MENKKTKKNSNFKGFMICVLFVVIGLIITAVIINNIAFPHKIKCKDTISTETITNLNQITLTKNNVYSIFNIEAIAYKKNNSDEADFTFKVNPQLKNYTFLNCSITFKYNTSSYNTEQITCILDINGKGKCSQKEIIEYYPLESCGYVIINVTGTIIKNT